jgi:uncharacterized cupredoxin-like copper-binding protein
MPAAARWAVRAAFAAGAVGVAFVACAGDGSSGGGGERRVTIDIEHSRFLPSELSFPAGTTVTFEIHNGDPIDHEFIVGDQALQDYIENTAHPTHDGSVPGQISVASGETRSTTYRFDEPGTLLLGCHLPRHYAYGMRGFVEVTA